MNLGEKIIRYIQELPESKKAEVLDFVEYLRNRTEERNWSEFSLSSAMKGMENDDSIYSLKDIKEQS
jgi:Mg/Co/Ni transporter MgtE